MGGGASWSTSSQSDRPFAKWSLPLFRDAVLPEATKLFQGFDVTGGPMRQAGDAQLADTLSGKYQSAATNPGLAGAEAAAGGSARDYLAQQIAKVTGTPSGGGALMDGKIATGGARQAALGQQDIADTIARGEGANFAQERQTKSQAAAGGLDASQFDLKRLLSFLDLLKGGESVSRSYGKSDYQGMAGGVTGQNSGGTTTTK